MSDDAVTMSLQVATHWGALTHASYSGKLYNGRPADSITAHGGAAFSGIDKLRHLVSRGVLLGVARAPGRDRLEGGHAVTPQVLDTAEELAGVRVRSGDIVLVRTGHLQTYLAGDEHAYAFPSPGLSVRTPEWFHAREAAAAVATFGDAPGAELESRKVVHSLWRNRPLRLPALRDPGTLHRRPRAARSPRSRSCEPSGRPTARVGWPPQVETAVRRRALPAPSTACAPPSGSGVPAPLLTVSEEPPGIIPGPARPEGRLAPEGADAERDSHSPRAPVTEAPAVPSRRIAAHKRDQTDTSRQYRVGFLSLVSHL